MYAVTPDDGGGGEDGGKAGGEASQAFGLTAWGKQLRLIGSWGVGGRAHCFWGSPGAWRVWTCQGVGGTLSMRPTLATAPRARRRGKGQTATLHRHRLAAITHLVEAGI